MQKVGSNIFYILIYKQECITSFLVCSFIKKGGSTGFFREYSFPLEAFTTSIVTSTSNFCAVIFQNLTGEFTRNTYAAS